MIVPAMTPEVVHQYLTELGLRWTGKGCAVEIGTWFGASARALLIGLVRAGYDKPFYAVDNWKVTYNQVTKAKEFGIDLNVGQNLEPVCRVVLESVYKNLIMCKGNIEDVFYWSDDRPLIEYMIIDAPKKNPEFAYTINQTCTYWIPGTTILGLLDYNHHVVRKYILDNKDNFEFMKDWPDKCSCAFFKYIGGSVLCL